MNLARKDQSYKVLSGDASLGLVSLCVAVS
jgi:hypothetical protein